MASRVVWLALGLGAPSIALELASAIRTGVPAAVATAGMLACAALSIAIALIAAIPVTLAAAASRAAVVRVPRARWARVPLAAVAGVGASWWLSDPTRRRIFGAYVIICLVAGAGVAVSVALSRARPPHLARVANLLLATAAAVALMMVPAGTYEELQDVAYLVCAVAVLAASSRLLAILAGRRAIGIALALAVLAYPLLRLADGIGPGWRAIAAQDGRGTSRAVRTMHALIDLDRDGFSPVVDGGDCADLDPSVHPLARDLPGGGDDNCNGVDPPERATDAERGLTPAFGAPALAPGAVSTLLLVTIDCWRADALDPDLTPTLWQLSTRGLRLERVYAAASATYESMPRIVGEAADGTWIGEIASGHGVRVSAVISGGVNVHLWGIPDVRPGGGSAQETTDAALSTLRGTTAPRLVWVHYYDLHETYRFPVGDDGRGTPAARHLARYRAAARAVDRAVDRLLDGLEAQGGLDRVAIVVTGDHGEGFGEHGIGGHGRSGFDEILRVPGILVAPGVSPAVSGGLASHRDLPATLLGLFGLEREAGAAERFGRSWLRWRVDASRPMHTFVVARSARHASGREVDAPLGVLVDDRYKLVAGLEDRLLELYDRTADPDEGKNLASDQPDLAREMWKRLALALDVDVVSPP